MREEEKKKGRGGLDEGRRERDGMGEKEDGGKS